MITYRTVLSLAAVAAALTACNSSGAGSSSPNPVPPVTSSSVSSTAPASPQTSSSVAAGGPSVEQPCSFITAAEMSQLLGASATLDDEGFRCKYNVGDGWLEVELMEFGGASAASIWDYDKAHGAAVAGVGDEAYIFGAAIVVKLGDVFIAVDGNNLPQPADDATLKAIATKIVTQIP
jgi:hypothetical protein